ncbi:MAG: hypothetical protein K6A40_13505 [Solobacterium sp.]|nr:hypothetical protein [Solobacterium sp.]
MNSREYFRWITEQEYPGLSIVLSDEDHITLEDEFCLGEINVYHLEIDVIEMKLTRKRDEENVFFLHFELKDADYAKKLFHEMTEVLKRERSRKTVRVMLSCTSGMTTSFFAQKLNEAADMLSLDYEFEAVAYNELWQKGFDSDVILLAPQIGFEYKKVRAGFTRQLVLRLPAQLFASYDAGAVIDLIKEELHIASVTKEEKAAAKVMRDIENNASIFVICMTHDADITKYIYRMFEKGNIVYGREVIRWQNSLQDIIDILDTELKGFHRDCHVDAISVSIPGVLQNNGKVERINYKEIASKLEERYEIPVYAEHNAVVVAYGYYAQQEEYDIITYHSQPRGGLAGGQGMVYRGMPITGCRKMAGEINGLYPLMYPDGVKEITPETVRDAVAKCLAANIAVFDPEVILVRSEMCPDMNELKEELKKYCPEKQQPVLIGVNDVSEYACLGAMLYGLHRLQKEAAKRVAAKMYAHKSVK